MFTQIIRGLRLLALVLLIGCGDDASAPATAPRAAPALLPDQVSSPPRPPQPGPAPVSGATGAPERLEGTGGTEDTGDAEGTGIRAIRRAGRAVELGPGSADPPRPRAYHGKPPIPRVRDRAAEVLGPLPQEVVQRALRRSLPAARSCYERGLYRRPHLQGDVTITFVIGVDGMVESSAATKSTLGDQAVERCLAQAVRLLRFPAADEAVSVRYPLALTTEEAPDSPPGAEGSLPPP